jgi:multidrug efflux system outer membrane protein
MRATHCLFLLPMLLAACTVGDDYAPPPVVLPDGWRDLGASQGEALANTPWWELYPDPVLHELVREALQQNRDLRLAVERIAEARARYGFVRADLYPKFDASAGVARSRASGEDLPAAAAGGDLERNSFAVGAGLSWELDLFGRIQRASEAQQAELFATEHARAAIALSLVAEVARAYVELRDLDRRLEIANTTLQSRREYLELVAVRYEGGLTSELDLRQAESELYRTTSQVHEFDRRVQQKENELNLLLGRNPGPVPRGAAVAAWPIPPQVPAGLPAELLQRRPDLRAAEQQLVAGNARVGEAKALLYPSISLTGFFGFASSELGDLAGASARTWSLGANVLQPIFHSGQLQSRVEISESQQRQILLGYEQALLRAFREVEDALVWFRKAGELRESEALRVAALRKTLELAEIRYRGDVAAYLDVLDAQRALLQAELDEAAAVRDHCIGLISLYRALGGGWPVGPETSPAGG